MKVADALSRHPAADKNPDPEFDNIEEVARAYAVTQGDCIESVTWRRVNEASSVDEESVALARMIADGFPETRNSLPPLLQKYWGMKDELYVIDNVPFKGKKMLIPSTLRSQALEGLHAANQGTTGMLSNARGRFFWPGLDAAIRNMRLQCRQCNEQALSQSAKPMIFIPPPDVPFQQVVADLFALQGHTFLAYADRFSGWLEVERLPSNALRNVRPVFLRWFSTYGVPEQCATDGGPPFNSLEYKNFLRTWDTEWRLSSVSYPQSNGRAEAAVKSAKRILLGNINGVTGALDTDAAARAIMNHRNTPAQDTGIAPSVMLFGRPLRDHLPRYDRKLRPEWDTVAESREMALAKRVTQTITESGKELEPLKVGDSVQIQNQTGNHPNKWSRTGIIAGVRPHRQYQVIIDGSRRISLRNRRFLKKILPVSRKVSDPSPEIGTVVPPVHHETPEPEKVVIQTPLPTEYGNYNIASVPPQDETIHVDAPDTSDVQPQQEVDVRPTTTVRRSTRGIVPRTMFSAKLTGKYHE